MAKSSSPPEAVSESGKSKSHWLPILLFLIFLAAFIYCVWLIWQQYAQARAARLEEQARLELLLKHKKELENLLELSPCEARDKAAVFLKPEVFPDSETKSSPRAEEIKENAAGGKAAPANAQDPDAIEAGCVFLVSLAGGNKLSTGSGFFIAPGYIATNRHVVGANPNKVLVTSKALGRPVPGRVIAKSSAKGEDFAIVKVDIPAGAHVKPLSFAADVKKTQKVGAWGFPNIIGRNDPSYTSLLKGENINAMPELSYSEGVVSAVLDRKPRVIAHTAPISPGNSGGPLVDESGKVVGINTMITLDEDSYRQASLALTADALVNFIKANGISLP